MHYVLYLRCIILNQYCLLLFRHLKTALTEDPAWPTQFGSLNGVRTRSEPHRALQPYRFLLLWWHHNTTLPWLARCPRPPTCSCFVLWPVPEFLYTGVVLVPLVKCKASLNLQEPFSCCLFVLPPLADCKSRGGFALTPCLNVKACSFPFLLTVNLCSTSPDNEGWWVNILFVCVVLF